MLGGGAAIERGGRGSDSTLGTVRGVWYRTREEDGLRLGKQHLSPGVG